MVNPSDCATSHQKIDLVKGVSDADIVIKCHDGEGCAEEADEADSSGL